MRKFYDIQNRTNYVVRYFALSFAYMVATFIHGVQGASLGNAAILGGFLIPLLCFSFYPLIWAATVVYRVFSINDFNSNKEWLLYHHKQVLFLTFLAYDFFILLCVIGWFSEKLWLNA
jgi:hypothetical protein